MMPGIVAPALPKKIGGPMLNPLSGGRGQVDRLGHGPLRDGERERAALPRGALHPDPAAVHLYELAGDGQAQAGALVFATHAALSLLKALEDPFRIFDRDADTGVAHADAELCALPSR